MIKIEKVVTPSPEQWERIIMGARNPLNSWDKSDSKIVKSVYTSLELIPGVESFGYEPCEPYYAIGDNDRDLMRRLSAAGTDHRKFMRMIVVYLDITAPLYFWKEFDTYKVGTVANSCSTMHKIHAKEFTLEDFSRDHLMHDREECWKNDVMAGGECISTPIDILEDTINALNIYRDRFLKAKLEPSKNEAARKDKMKKYWWQMIQLLPSSYNQKRTVLLNYEVLANIYKSRKTHKLDEWIEFCSWIETLPYSEIITGKQKEKENAE